MRLRIGEVPIDGLTMAEALDAIERLCAAGKGGLVFTPNIDHVVNAARVAEFREAYARADLSLPDGQPLIWSSRLLGKPLPEKVSGSDLIGPLAERAGQKGLSLFLLGAGPGVAEEAGRRLAAQYAVRIAGTDSPRIGADGSCADEVLAKIRAAQPALILVALGSPKQELWMARNAAAVSPAVSLGIGASLDFVAGTAKRAPAWMSRNGLEWLYRLAHEPRRLARRYLWDDPRYLAILYRTWRGGKR